MAVDLKSVEEANKTLRSAQEALDRLEETNPSSAAVDVHRVQLQYYITKAIVAAYLGVIGAAVLLVAYQQIWGQQGEATGGPNAIEQLFELIKVAVIPVTTFAIGHFFGSRSSAQ